MTASLFRFEPRWKEELVVSSPGGAFVLELAMGQLTAYLPGEAEWLQRAPGWANNLWPDLRAELEVWCRENNAKFQIDPSAVVYPL